MAPQNGPNKTAQSNLGRGPVTTPGGRPIYNHCAQSFNCICQVALMCTAIQYMISLAYPTHRPKLQLYQFSGSCMANATFYQYMYVTLCRPNFHAKFAFWYFDGYEPHQIFCSLDLTDPPPQKASQSSRPFLHYRCSLPTDINRHTDRTNAELDR